MPPYSTLLISALLFASAQPPSASHLSGRILDPNGAPVPAATVIAKRVGGLLPSSAGGTTSDAQGIFHLTLREAGDYVLRILPPGAPPSATPGCSECCAPRTEFEPTDFPAPGPQPALHVEKGQTRSDLAVTLHRAPVYCVQGEVRAANGAPCDEVTITLETPDGSASVLHQGGRFLLTNLRSGTYHLAIREPGLNGRVLIRELIRVRGQNGRVAVRLR